MSWSSRFRAFLALGADVIGVAIGLGVLVAAIVGLWNQASLHLAQPWLTLILIGVFLLVAGIAGRGLRYLPPPRSGNRAVTAAPAPVAQPAARPVRYRTGPAIPIPPLGVQARTNGPNIYLAITNRDEDPADIYAEATELRGVSYEANLPWRMLWVGGGHATLSMRPDETQIIDVGAWRDKGFVLHSPMGDLGIGSFTELLIRARVHYGDGRTDYALTVTANFAPEGDPTFMAFAVEWDKR